MMKECSMYINTSDWKSLSCISSKSPPYPYRYRWL